MRQDPQPLGGPSGAKAVVAAEVLQQQGCLDFALVEGEGRPCGRARGFHGAVSHQCRPGTRCGAMSGDSRRTCRACKMGMTSSFSVQAPPGTCRRFYRRQWVDTRRSPAVRGTGPGMTMTTHDRSSVSPFVLHLGLVLGIAWCFPGFAAGQATPVEEAAVRRLESLARKSRETTRRPDVRSWTSSSLPGPTSASRSSRRSATCGRSWRGSMTCGTTTSGISKG